MLTRSNSLPSGSPSKGKSIRGRPVLSRARSVPTPTKKKANAHRRNKLELPKSKPYIHENSSITLRDVDVVVGKGGWANNHPGNRYMRSLLRANKEVYKSLENFDKTTLTRNLVRSLQARGGRFLERDKSGGWRIMEDNRARKKVSAAIRDVKINEDAPLDAHSRTGFNQEDLCCLKMANSNTHELPRVPSPNDNQLCYQQDQASKKAPQPHTRLPGDAGHQDNSSHKKKQPRPQGMTGLPTNGQYPIHPVQVPIPVFNSSPSFTLHGNVPMQTVPLSPLPMHMQGPFYAVDAPPQVHRTPPNGVHPGSWHAWNPSCHVETHYCSRCGRPSYDPIPVEYPLGDDSSLTTASDIFSEETSTNQDLNRNEHDSSTRHGDYIEGEEEMKLEASKDGEIAFTAVHRLTPGIHDKNQPETNTEPIDLDDCEKF